MGFFKKFITIFLYLVLSCSQLWAKEQVGLGVETQFTQDELNDVVYIIQGDDTYEIAALTVLAILASVGMYVVRRSIIRTLSAKAASKAATNYARGQMKKVGRKCFSVRGDGGARILLSLDRETVIWGGNSHDMYEKKLINFVRDQSNGPTKYRVGHSLFKLKKKL